MNQVPDAERVRALLTATIAVHQRVLETSLEPVVAAATAIREALAAGGKLLIFGNGGSAADAQHMAAELMGRFERERAALAAVALTTDTSILSAIGNDYGFDGVFARQIEGLGRPGDVALGISTSGGSVNVIAGAGSGAKPWIENDRAHRTRRRRGRTHRRYPRERAGRFDRAGAGGPHDPDPRAL